LEPRLQAFVREVLDVQLSDTVKARRLLADGRWQRLKPEGAGAIRAQRRLYELIAHHEDDPSSHSNSPGAAT
jgi:polyphosphate kinase